MKNSKFYIAGLIIIFSAIFSTYTFAQHISVGQQQRALNAALSTIDNYSVWSTVSDAEAHFEFLELFVDKKSMIYNDLLGIKRDKSLTVGEYANTLLHELRNKKVFIKNIKNEGVNNEKDQIRVSISLDKAISYIDSCGTYFSSSEFYKTDHHLLFILVYDDQTQSCKIESITGVINSSNKLNYPYFAFISEDKRDSLLYYKGKLLAFNSYHQALIEGMPDKKRFRYADPNVIITPVTDECDHISVRYREPKFRIKPHFDLGLGESLDLEGKDIFNSNKSTYTSFGLDFGYIIPSKKTLKTGVFMGVGMSQTKLEMSKQDDDYILNSTADVDGDSYVRHYQNLILNQTAKITELNVPLYADFDYYFSPIFSMYLDLGIRMNFAMKHELDESNGSAYIYGIYPQYDNLYMDEHWGYNDFGNQTFSNSDLVYSELKDYKSFSLDVTGRIGARINIPRTPLAVDISGCYTMGLTDIVSTQDAATDFVYADTYSPHDIDKIQNMVGMLKSVKRKSLSLNIGLFIKF